MKKVKVGVMGAYRGTSMINYCEIADNAEVVAICDKWKEGLERQKQTINDPNITFYDNFDDFIKHDMDAVVLANYATEHAPFAIKALKAGKHVFSEVLPVQTLKEAVELIDAIEETGLIYAYGENYCYMPAPYEMKKLYKEGKIGEIEYAECEYVHNCEYIWPSIAYGDKNHWRNNVYSTYYCTHSFGPIIHMTGLRPVSVIGFEGKYNDRNYRVGKKSGSFGIEMVTLENGAVVKSLHGSLYKHSIWYSVYGEKGRMESQREDCQGEGVARLYVNSDEKSGAYGTAKLTTYLPVMETEGIKGKSGSFGHSGSDFFSMYHFIRKIQGDKDADIIDIYEALDMAFAGIFAYRSCLKGNIPMEIPNFRIKEVREKYRNDTACTDPKVAGDQLLPTYSKGTPEIPDEIYENQKKLWKEAFNAKDGYVQMAFHQGGKNSGHKPE